VPSDLVFNDFLPTGGNNGAGLGVRDAGGEGGLAGMVGGGSGAEAADQVGGAGGEGAEKARVTESGTEPRAVRKYAFVANRVDKRQLVIDQAVSQSIQGQPAGPPQGVTFKLTLDVTPKQVKPSGATLEAKVTKVELPGAPPEAAKMLASVNGLTGSFDVSPAGDAGEMSFAATQQMKNQLAESVVQGLSQAAELLVIPFPAVPIGNGAKWELGGSAGARGEQGTKRFTLSSVTAEGGTVDVEVEIKVPRHAQQSPRGGGPMFVEVDGKGKYTYQVKFDRTSPKVDGETTINQKIEVSDPRAPGTKQQVVQTQKSKSSVDVPK
jgi:hypothetical protein